MLWRPAPPDTLLFPIGPLSILHTMKFRFSLSLAIMAVMLAGLPLRIVCAAEGGLPMSSSAAGAARQDDFADWFDITTWLHPYRINLRQGNLVTPDMLSQLKTGMTEDQVRFLLGTPLLMDIFHANRWDYIYRFESGDGPIDQRRLTLFFQGGKLARFEGNALSEISPIEQSTDRAATRVIDIKPRTP